MHDASPAWTAARREHWAGNAVVVTGAARGQGAALARRLLDSGAVVHAVDVIAAGDPAWQPVRDAADGRLHVWQQDVADPAGWDRLADALRDGAAALLGLVNNAGITGPRHTVTQTRLSEWERVLAVNLTGCMLGIRALGPVLARGGAVVNVSSTVGMTGYHSAAYSATKWALRGLTRSAAMDLASRGVRVNCVCPGVVDTGMIRGSPALVDALQGLIPMQAMAAPAQIADAVLFLLEPQSAYVTGADLAVDGGVTGGGLYWQVGIATGALAPSPPAITPRPA